MLSRLIAGFTIGFCIAAPVGPIGLLCIRRSLEHGRVVGFVSGLGAATADAAGGLVAALGLTAISGFLVAQRSPIQLFGGLFLVYLGLSGLRVPASDGRPPSAPARTLLSAYSSTLALTLANPVTILAFISVFASFGVGAVSPDAASAGLLVAGVFLGSATWWLVLSSAASWLGSRMGARRIRAVNIASALVIAGFGGWQLALLAR